MNISIHALREEGDWQTVRDWQDLHRISIHALREEGDFAAFAALLAASAFLSTPSARRATSSGESILPLEEISIHALREEGDVSSLQ